MDPTLFFSPEAPLRYVMPVIAISLIALEFGVSRLARHDHATYDLAESATSLVIAVGNKIVKGLEAGLVAIPFVLAYQHRLFDFPATAPLAIAALFLATEFLYYWFHRASHRIRWMWATHSVHHSATHFNLTAAIRLGWTGQISGNFLFFLVLPLIGFHPFSVVGMLGLNLAYQFFVHTEAVPRLGPLEWVLNTPAHHRVHHASNASCLDKNYGGILIVFDRLFGTFAEAPVEERLRYGLAGKDPDLNPVRINFSEWIAMAKDFRSAATWRDRILSLFGPPGISIAKRGGNAPRRDEMLPPPSPSEPQPKGNSL
ncbi:sterol desaturase family protein [Roseibium aggregatum]|uniref:Sterol desaturase family protein n=1 Tax=Roseibium aggregatum TaxID=187304 RepID=A0A939EFJ0_9HYPH|nr:sterol desaturase family protein [Roseibium aggregatum]MBN9670855.1 sterol desaturase family protein [Roseibium aggregatum]